MHLKPSPGAISTAAILLVLIGCAAPRPSAPPVGDPSRPLMAAGEGLVAASLTFKTQEPDYKRYRLVYTANYVPADQPKGGGKGYAFSMGTLSGPSQYLDKAREPNETVPMVMLLPVKAGKYKVERIGVLGETTHAFWPTHPKEIEVIAGRVTYVGAAVIEYTTSYKGAGVLTPSVKAPQTRNDFERDMADLKVLEKRLESVPATNALTQ
jgi:hypothetical protein